MLLLYIGLMGYILLSYKTLPVVMLWKKSRIALVLFISITPELSILSVFGQFINISLSGYFSKWDSIDLFGLVNTQSESTHINTLQSGRCFKIACTLFQFGLQGPDLWNPNVSSMYLYPYRLEYLSLFLRSFPSCGVRQPCDWWFPVSMQTYQEMAIKIVINHVDLENILLIYILK